MDPDATYVHGTSPEEQRRLELLNRILNERELPLLGLREGERVLEMGAGTGVCALDMAARVAPGGRVVAVERSEEQLAEAARLATARREGALVDSRRGDAYDPPLEAGELGTFDVAHCRFLLEHVSDPERVVRQLVRAVRPGGRIALADDDHELLRAWPEPEGFPDLWRIYWRQFERLGNDAFVGRKLVAILARAGATPRRNESVFFGACAGHPAFAAVVENLAGVIGGAREVILRSGEIDAEHLDRALENLRRWGERPDAALWYGLSWAEGVRS